jgi:hypothetical protein
MLIFYLPLIIFEALLGMQQRSAPSGKAGEAGIIDRE